MNTSNGPLEYLAAFAIVLGSGALLGLVLGWGGASLFHRLLQRRDWDH
ncbi:hypothetical protein [Variovorax guangxiensis]|nr:hypothetical protein [Variovorax guangxiensis]